MDACIYIDLQQTIQNFQEVNKMKNKLFDFR